MINLKNVSLVFQGGSVAISNISTKVEEGEFVYLVGHSGSGKSSFLKLLYKEYIATKGLTFSVAIPPAKVTACCSAIPTS